MHILMISHMYPNKYNPNLGIFVKKQIEALIEFNIKVTVLAPIPLVFSFIKYFSLKWRNYSLVPKEEISNGVRVIHTRFLAFPTGFLKQYWAYSNYYLFRKVITELHNNEKIDVVHVQGSAPDDYAGYLISQKLKIPYIQTLHGDALLNLSQKGKRFSRSKIAIEKANAVIAVSSKIESKVFELTNRKENIFKILNGYIPFTLDQTTTKEINENVFNIFFAGNLIRQKGCHLLIEAFSKIHSKYRNLRLQIAGNGVEANNLKDIVKKLGLERKVVFYGNIEHNKLLSLMSQCDIFIMPSWNEAFGIVYLEAMSFEKPVIGTFGEGIDDLIEDGKNGLLVKPKSVDSIVEKLTILIENKKYSDQLAENGYKSIKKLTWEFNAQQIVEVYNKLHY